MDFQLDRISWLLLFFMWVTFVYFLLPEQLDMLTFAPTLKALGLGLLVLIILVGLMCIPVLIICYFIKKIPDIDYSVWGAFAFTIVGIITELV